MAYTAPLPEEIKTDVIEKICNLYATGLYSSADCCTMNGISDRTFRNWRTASEFANKSYSEACIKRLAALRTEMTQKAANAIVVALEGAETTETTIVSTVEYKDGKIVLDENNLPKKKVKEIRTKTTKAAPCATTARFVLQKLQRADFGDNEAGAGGNNQQIDIEEREEVLQAALLEAQAQQNQKNQKQSNSDE